ncbi:hemerythrin domain-containing protein [Caenimonas sedimenti]|uniref:Hemerythrin domain-containing protein n=1 Tax=Caenimonas sedimenti TaxID=2596921 RepID=A0A562ZP76_9BURK|nr:hemerythrin domain-containing protein [Caenimonas sedimenti]TWO70115.1 hemerythrin domain-containing protein [Caenimonas sedimenti]
MPQIPDNKDACELLDADHIAVKHLFVEYARLATAAPDDSAADRTALALKICAELTVHAQIEEEIFYPALREALPDAGDLLEEAEAEHQEAKDLIAQIQALGQADAEMDALVARLNGAIEHHVKEERDELFPKAKAAPEVDLVALGEQLRQRQAELAGQAATT